MKIAHALHPQQSCELVFLNSKNAPMLATLTVVPLSGSERRVAEPLAPKEGESLSTYLLGGTRPTGAFKAALL